MFCLKVTTITRQLHNGHVITEPLQECIICEKAHNAVYAVCERYAKTVFSPTVWITMKFFFFSLFLRERQRQIVMRHTLYNCTKFKRVALHVSLCISLLRLRPKSAQNCKHTI